MTEQPGPPIEEWYRELIITPDDREPSPAELEAALETVRVATRGIEGLIEAGKIVKVEVSFDITSVAGENIGFSFSSDE